MKKSQTKRALVMSVLSMLLCFTMLVGTTFAWFTDEVKSGDNKIVAGNLDVELKYLADDGSLKTVEGETKLFQPESGLWEPGVIVAETFEVSNIGTLALKYVLSVNVGDFVGPKSLANVLKVAFVEDKVADRAAALALDFQPLQDVANYGDIKAEGEPQTWTVVIYWEPSDKDNDYNLAEEVSINLGINLFATQLEAESDSFGTEYDAAANLGKVVAFSTGTHTLNANIKAGVGEDAITASGSAVVNVTGGTYEVTDAADPGYCAVWANAGTVNVYGGTFIHAGRAAEATSADHLDLIYASNNGKINIYGGYFYARNNGVWLLNEKDNAGEIVVYGGTFVNWNPADNVSEGANTSFLADGYTVVTTTVNGDTLYTVVSEAVQNMNTTLAAGGNATMTVDVVTSTNITLNGGALDGNGKTLTASYSGTGSNAGVLTTGGSISNLTVVNGDTKAEKGLRAVYVTGAITEDTVINNCVLDGTYTINVNSNNNAYGLYVSNSTLNGWTSYGTIKEAVFTNCEFGEGSTGYANLRPYTNTTLTNCEFATGFTITRNSTVSNPFTIELVNCTVNGVAVTADNFMSLLAGTADSYSLHGCADVTVIVDGVTVVK
ncbi:MAG: hypothetical protein IJY39_06940 [Clostridia bacterium]|nr:hypothetical protein [Clostridia bacterium]